MRASGVMELTHRHGSMRSMKLHLPIVMPDEAAAPTRRPLRIALVTETYPPEVNGVALTVARVAEGLQPART